MSMDRMPITVRGKELLEKELQQLLQVVRPRVIKDIEEARSHGDLSENAEYDAAKEQQALVEGRINGIQGMIATADVVDPSRIKSDRIVFGAYFTIEDCETGDKVTYQIVGIDEAEVKEGRISVLSPIARAVIGKTDGDLIVVRSPKGEKEFEVAGFEFK